MKRNHIPPAWRSPPPHRHYRLVPSAEPLWVSTLWGFAVIVGAAIAVLTLAIAAVTWWLT